MLPSLPRVTAALLWLLRHVPDSALLDGINRKLAAAWDAVMGRAGISSAIAPRVDREALHWMSADHYYDTARLASIGFRPLYPVSTEAMATTIRALVAARVLPGTGSGALPAW